MEWIGRTVSRDFLVYSIEYCAQDRSRFYNSNQLYTAAYYLAIVRGSNRDQNHSWFTARVLWRVQKNLAGKLAVARAALLMLHCRQNRQQAARDNAPRGEVEMHLLTSYNYTYRPNLHE